MKFVIGTLCFTLGLTTLTTLASTQSKQNTLSIQSLALLDNSTVTSLKSRYMRAGLNQKTRPFLYKLLSEMNVLELGSEALPIDMLSSSSCQASPVRDCFHFNNFGFAIDEDEKTGELFLTTAAMYSQNELAEYILLDIQVTNAHGEIIIDYQTKEFFSDGAEQKRKIISAKVPLKGIKEKIKQSDLIVTTSVLTTFLDNHGERKTFYKQIQSEHAYESIAALQSGSNKVLYSQVSIQHPIDNTSSSGAGMLDGKINVCLNRHHSDCDYVSDYPYDTPVADLKLRLPMKGSYTIFGKVKKIYRRDWTSFDVIEMPGNNLWLNYNPVKHQPTILPYPTNSYIQTLEGGGTYLFGNTEFSDLNKEFSEYLSLKYIQGIDGRESTEISWDIPADKGTFGNSYLYYRQQNANWFVHLSLAIEYMRGPRKITRDISAVTGSFDVPGSYLDTYQPPLQIVYSCLAGESQITMFNGDKKPIEKLKVGEIVIGSSQFSPEHKIPLIISDISVGTEILPMIEITTRKGATLLLTESHPVVTGSGQSIWSSKVNLGQSIMTESGLDIVEKVNKIAYDKPVYNLKLTRINDSSNDIEGETFNMFANGLLVGDLATQLQNEFEEVSFSRDEMLKRIPSYWHQDYLNSLN
ncbi:Hint domain-containing protein [Pseudoalteromonas luteoviolacea]|uniref:Hint domain-containing protein n=1 Tax=Pseudoalteromonas luteoviolacea S4054 TaxID=1129367 RepID=A0A0F6AE64_9GAMM|nr:Hint domain-containing protein [Pseudoalteromonas luteoviolacea]AOT08120.1 hypothetical protein S4054249_09805 [Pseudoalteromonas luteoviolacea]AOT13037.1 hypothetical protein S40542_09805 [Pseudoalteromonas luteoviolacea]AOT17949.1 hypothetical protein S4054_09800 [Pseudoalteromonas luteoviolacea]KKE84507.1 hypothetical protein N479_08775 [Pseudoalteromonas luteoviolacea S4054]KZN69519.1 hypothetical protein N481_22265 [Pseudoalteromonas luteoviolacea S4047-1]